MNGADGDVHLHLREPFRVDQRQGRGDVSGWRVSRGPLNPVVRAGQGACDQIKLFIEDQDVARNLALGGRLLGGRGDA